MIGGAALGMMGEMLFCASIGVTLVGWRPRHDDPARDSGGRRIHAGSHRAAAPATAGWKVGQSLARTRTVALNLGHRGTGLNEPAPTPAVTPLWRRCVVRRGAMWFLVLLGVALVLLGLFLWLRHRLEPNKPADHVWPTW